MNGFSVASGMSEPLRIVYTHRTTGTSGAVVISEPYAFLGRHPQNTIQLDDPSVSKKHAYLQVIEGCLFVVDLGGRTGIRIDGKAMTMGWVESDAELQLGEFDINFGHHKRVGDRSSPTSHSLESSTLELTSLSDLDEKDPPGYPLRAALTLIGRDAMCNLRLPDERIRPFHASIVQTDSDAWLIDLLGSGGTRLNDRLARCAMLQVGDRLNLNGLQLDVQLARSSSIHGRIGALEPVSNTMAQFTPAGEITQPLVDQVGDLRQATLLMASLFAEMKREQTQLMQRQIVLMEVMTQAFRDSRPGLPAPQISPATPKESTPAVVPLQQPRATNSDEQAALAQAHEWFMSRLGKLGGATS